MKKIVKTPGQRYFEEGYPNARWDNLHSSDRETYEVKASRLGIQPEVKEVPDKPTDGELFERAMLATRVDCGKAITHNWKKSAAEFLRLRRERDGDPLEVTAEMLSSCWNPGQSWGEFADKLNAKLAEASKPANKPEPLKVAAFATRNGVLHTFESREDFSAFLAANSGDCNMLGRPDRWVHHAKKEASK